MQKIYPLFPILEISFKTSARVMNLLIVHNCLILGVNKNWPKDCLQSVQCKYLLVIGFVFQLFYFTRHFQPERCVPLQPCKLAVPVSYFTIYSNE